VPSTPKARFIFLVVLLLFVFFPGLRVPGLAGYDDALYAHEAKEMLRTGDWWNVRFNGELNFEYPPMFLWLDASSMRIFGVNDFAAKLPAAVAGLGTVLALYFLALRMSGDDAFAWGSALVLATTQPFLKLAGHAMTDVPFTFFCTLALLFYAMAMNEGRGPWLPLAGVAVGCAILTRSVLGLTPLAVIAVHMIFWRRVASLWSKQFVTAIMFSLAIPLVWMGSQYRLHSGAFLAGHLGFVSQKVTGANAGIVHGVTYSVFGVELAKYYWPWLPVMLAGLVYQMRVMRKDSAAAFAVIWALAVVVPLGFAGTQYGRYILPAFPPFAMLSTAALLRWIPARRRGLAFAIGYLGLAAVAVYAGAFPGRERGNDMRILAPTATALSNPGERVLLYTSGEPSYDYRNQFVWYAGRFVDQVTNFKEMADKLAQAGAVTAVIDKPSFERLRQDPAVAARLIVAAEGQNFVCVRTRESAEDTKKAP